MDRVNIKYIYITVFIILIFSSCRTTYNKSAALYDPKEVAQLSDKLGIILSNINKDDDDNMPLYAEAALWLGVPYRYGGLTRGGVDCSGFTYILYDKVYRLKIPRSTKELSEVKMKKISHHKLKAGDLVFFATTTNKKKISHVGVYLKDGYFVHASTQRGVVVNHLDENYYKKNWRKGGRIR